jgi:hypothetical protein
MHREALAKPLTFLIIDCLQKGVFPRALKHAIVKPIFKSGDREATQNYRPVAIIQTFSKVFEYDLFSRTLNHLKNNKIISDFQFGFVTSNSSSYIY